MRQLQGLPNKHTASVNMPPTLGCQHSQTLTIWQVLRRHRRARRIPEAALATDSAHRRLRALAVPGNDNLAPRAVLRILRHKRTHVGRALIDGQRVGRRRDTVCGRVRHGDEVGPGDLCLYGRDELLDCAVDDGIALPAHREDVHALCRALARRRHWCWYGRSDVAEAEELRQRVERL